MQNIVDPAARVDQPVRRRGFFGWCLRLAVLGVLAVYFVVGLAILGVRYWVLPNAPEYREQIAAAVSARIGRKVTIGSIEARWQHLHPYLELGDVRIHDRADAVALKLPTVAATIAWQSLLVWDLRFDSVVVKNPRVAVRRDPAGRLHVAGLELENSGGGEPGLGDWVLRQRELMITGGEIEWTDELRKAPPLALREFEFRLLNQLGNRHRLALSALPPAALASRLDVRADLVGRSFADLARWRGELYARFDYTDLAGWSRWVDYPLRVTKGRGGLSVWLGFEDGKIIKSTADMALADFAARMHADLPELKLTLVRGRLGAREARQGRGFLRMFESNPTVGYRVFGAGVELVPAQGKSLPPLDFSLAWDAGAEGKDPKGEFSASGLELAPLVDVAEALPLPKRVRALLAQADPRGRLGEVGLAWTGALDALRAFSARGRFSDLAMNGAAERPGFAGLSGSFEASEKSGAVRVEGRKVELAYPAVFHSAPKLVFDELEASIGWTLSGRDDARVLELRLPSVRAANAEIEASFSGSWRGGATPTTIDISATIPRAEVKAIPRYIPFLDGTPAQWLRAALVNGRATEGSLRLKGPLERFPFEARGEGVFEVKTKFTEGVLRFADDWPAIEGINGDYAINGVGMTINAERGTIAGIPVSATRAQIANFFSEDPLLVVEGNAEGRTSEFLRFIGASPVRGLIDGATDGLSADGNGRLALRLDLPLARPSASKVSAQYTLVGNELRFADGQPPLTSLSGRLELANGGIEARNLAAQFLGGPVALNVSSRADGLAISGQGSAPIEAVRGAYDVPFAAHMQGVLAYRTNISIAASGINVEIESPLTGLAIDLPPPFGKSAAEPLALRLVRASGDSARDTLDLQIGTLLSASARYRTEGGASVLERMGIGVGEAAAVLPERPGIALAVNLKRVDYDRLAPVLPKAAPGEPGKGAGGATLNAINLQAAELVAFGRTLQAVNLRAQLQGDAWNASVSARETEGEVVWRPEGRGRLSARLKHLNLPEAAPAQGSSDSSARELPAIDLVAERFRAGVHDFGRLELTAINDASAWKIENLAMTTPEGKIHAAGTWQPGSGGPASDRTELAIEVDVGDAGRYLARFGQADAVRNGKATIAGTIGWSGSPASVDYATLNGKLRFNASTGQFLKVDPGIGRLLGVVSLQSLPRRISLDFRDVFSEGFAFDDIAATAAIAKGVLNTEDFRMAGPAAAVVIKGDADLSKETQNLHVKVVPVVGDSIAAVAGLALLNPVVGIGTLIAQRLLRDPLGEIFSYEYQITGAWSDPKVARLSRLKPAANPEGN